MTEITWDGEGKPPVGIVCEYRDCDNGWVETRILAHHPRGNAVWHESYWGGGFSDGKSYSTDSHHAFRPILTDEQRAVEGARAFLNREFTRFGKPSRTALLSALYREGLLKEKTHD